MAAVGVRINPVGVAVVGAVTLLLSVYLFGLPSIFKSEQKVNMKELLSVSIDLARRGAVKVQEVRKSNNLDESVKGKTKEGAKEMLTNADLESHRAIVYGFKKAFPDLNVISEEHETKPVDLGHISEPSKNLAEVQGIDSKQMIPISDIHVWIDPLDATQEFTEDLQQYVTTLVCVAVRGQPIIGVIQHVFEDKTEWGYVGYGHSSNLDTDVPAKQGGEANKIIVSRSHQGDVEKVAKEAFGENTVVIPAGGAGYKTSEVIQGHADAYVHVTFIKKWDICAGNAIINAKGGRMTTVEGRNIDYSQGDPGNENGLVASLKNHNIYLEKLRPGFLELKKKSHH